MRPTDATDSGAGSRRARFWHADRCALWLPYALIALTIFVDYALTPLVRERRFAELGRDGRPAWLIAWLALAVAYVALARRRALRLRLLGATLAALVVLVGGLSVLQRMLPALERSTTLQAALRDQLARRDRTEHASRRGVAGVARTNRVGWMGRDWSFEHDAPRIVFVGDSFLESFATATLAERVESRLRAGGWSGDVVNLSKFSTAPDPEYRHRLHELVWDYAPDHVVLFLFSGNDLNGSYFCQPYRHPTFRMSERALEACRAAELPAGVLADLEAALREEREWADRASFEASIDVSRLSGPERHLAYLTVLAYAPPEERSFAGRTWARVLGRLERLDELWKPWKKAIRGRSPALTAEIQEEFEALFERPPDERLDRLVELVQRRFADPGDGPRVRELIENLPAELLDYVLSEPESPALLFKALWLKLHDQPVHRPPKESQVERIRREYATLLADCAAVSREHGATFSVVLIPQGGAIDEEFQAFWSPLIDTAAHYDSKRAAREALAAELDAGPLPFLDLGRFADRFRGGYWKMDGHWNEAGLDAAAELVAEHLAESGPNPTSIR